MCRCDARRVRVRHRHRNVLRARNRSCSRGTMTLTRACPRGWILLTTCLHPTRARHRTFALRSRRTRPSASTRAHRNNNHTRTQHLNAPPNQELLNQVLIILRRLTALINTFGRRHESGDTAATAGGAFGEVGGSAGVELSGVDGGAGAAESGGVDGGLEGGERDALGWGDEKDECCE